MVTSSFRRVMLLASGRCRILELLFARSFAAYPNFITTFNITSQSQQPPCCS
jgi:hypothetical protein